MSKKRYNMVVPQELYDNVEQVAKEEHTSVVEVLKKFIKIGLLFEKVKEGGGEMIIKEGDKEKRIIY